MRVAAHGRTDLARRCFGVLRDRVNSLALVAEDLGVITPDVDALRDAFGLPGIRVLQFAFSGDTKTRTSGELPS
jgi:4-alpha-glucanotransferase